MAHKKGQGASRNGRDSNAQRRGIKAYGGEYVTAGSIIVRQCGTKFHAGKHVGCGKDYTLYALKEGRVKYLPNRKVLIELAPLPGSTADAVASSGSTADAVEA